jgi:hypothetical protein
MSCIVDGKSLIENQLSATGPATVDFEQGASTGLTPTRYVPQLDTPTMALSLDGAWQVSRWPFAVEEETLAAPACDDRNWETVQQPGKVFYADPEAEGDPQPNWDRVGLGHINDEDGAMLRRRVRIPQAWQGKRIYLRFDSIYPAGRIYLDGQLLVAHFSGLTPVQVDVTDRVAAGTEVQVAVRLLRKHKFVKMDMVRHAAEFAGLAQSACLMATESAQVADYHLISTLNSALDWGELAGQVTLRNHGEAATGTLRVSVADSAGAQVAAVTEEISLASGVSVDVPVSLTLDQPALWNDEYPTLYTVTLDLAMQGQTPQTLSYRTGFRTLELTPEGPKLNGQFVKFRGVNHLTFHPQHGMHTPKEWLRRNLSLMKKANVNAIRTHFLGPRCLAELCDEMGLYLMQELPIDWGTNYIHDPEWVGPALMRLEGGIRRDRHHPSIMVWSVGNENMPESAAVADDGWNHLRIYDRFCKTLDPSRPTMFPPPGPANKIEGIFEVRVGDIADTHYSFNLQQKFNRTGSVTNPRSWEADMETTTRDEAIANGWSGVWFSSEYGIFNSLPDVLNGPYLSVIADQTEDILSGKNSLQVFAERLHREWGSMRHDPTCLGGAYFPWLCSGAGLGEEGNPWGWVRWAEDADWGVVTADLTPKPQFWALRVLFSPVWFPQTLVWKKGETELCFTVQNQYNAIDLSECTLRTQMVASGKWMAMVRQYRDVPVSAAPGEVGQVKIPIWHEGSLKALESGRACLCRCHLLDPQGFRPITADILVVPEELAEASENSPALMPLGPDAVL